LELDHSLDPSSQRLFVRMVLQERARTEHAITQTLGYVRISSFAASALVSPAATSSFSYRALLMLPGVTGSISVLRELFSRGRGRLR
jgi:hypothetical protein